MATKTRIPHTAIMLAKALAEVGDKGMARKEMVILLLANQGHLYSPRRSGYGSVGFFTINGKGAGGVYWERGDDGRYRITELGKRLAETGQVATKEEKEAVYKAWLDKMKPIWDARAKERDAERQRERQAIDDGFDRMRQQARDAAAKVVVNIRGMMIPLSEVQAAVKAALA